MLYKVKNGYTLIDIEDLPKMKLYKWKISTNGYVVFNKRPHTLFLHKYLLGIGTGTVVDHANRFKRDNRKKNLRVATISQNAFNNNRPIGFSGVRGVYWEKDSRKWRAQINFKRKKIMLGSFKTIEDARNVYIRKAKELYGDFVPA